MFCIQYIEYGSWSVVFCTKENGIRIDVGQMAYSSNSPGSSFSNHWHRYTGLHNCRAELHHYHAEFHACHAEMQVYRAELHLVLKCAFVVLSYTLMVLNFIRKYKSTQAFSIMTEQCYGWGWLKRTPDVLCNKQGCICGCYLMHLSGHSGLQIPVGWRNEALVLCRYPQVIKYHGVRWWKYRWWHWLPEHTEPGRI